ncbi:polysulfide reductase NrfD [bacterium]|nr:polysulfide reductase NrfD [bacterium]
MSAIPANNQRALDNTVEDPASRPQLVLGNHDFASMTDVVCRVIEAPNPPKIWTTALIISSLVAVFFFSLVAYLITKGIGVWGNNNPVGWAFDITNFVFWIGIGHAGTLISAILYLLRQRWRTSINRSAEAMTIFAVVCAGLFPLIHVGRIWLVYWMFPIPNQEWVWPQFRSPLLWDVFAISTYFLVSLLFWSMGLIPDVATVRDRAKGYWQKLIYGILALGWRGSMRHWQVYEKAYLLLAAFSTPLVLSVHSVVSFDFATAQLPGWHTTIFPPYFVAGAIFGGFAMVVTLLIPARKIFGLEDIITMHHLENCAKVILATGMMVGYAYATEMFIAWYSGNLVEQFTFLNRAMGPYAWAYWIMIFCNVASPQLFWWKKFRTSIWSLMVVAIFVDIGMWFERFVIIVSSLNRDWMPSSWAPFVPTWVDLGMLFGSMGLFMTLFLLFCRFLPLIAMAEIRGVMPQAEVRH